MKIVGTLVVISGLTFAGVAAPRAQGTPAQIEAGKKAYDAKKCKDCHTIGGKGGTLTKQYPLDGVGAKLSTADIISWLTHTADMEAKSEAKPKTKMSSKKIALTPAEVDGLVAYMSTLKTKAK